MKPKKLFLIISIIFTLCVCFGITANAETEGIFTYSYDIYTDGVKIDKCDISASGDIIIPSILGGYPVTTIEYNAFSDCKNLTSITIPDSVTSIYPYAFYYCSSLTSINVDRNNSNYLSEYGVLFNKNKTELISYPIGKNNNSYSIPESVTTIADQAFAGCNGLTSINMPDSVTTIGTQSFAGCKNLTSITLSNSIKTISCQAFIACDSLTSITIPDSVTTIESIAFSCDNLTSITIPDSVTNIGNRAFGFCDNLKNVYYSGSALQWANISMGDNAFLSSTNISYNCTYITYSFDSNKGTDVLPIKTYQLETSPTTTLSYGNFLGWYDNEELIGETIIFPYNNDKDITLYAKWDYSDKCDIVQLISPDNAIILSDEITVKLPNNVESLKVNISVSDGATWGLYRISSATKPLDNTITGLRIGRDNIYYIKTLAADGVTGKIYKLILYRNSKSISPTISANRDKITINAENCEIYYTIDGTTPTESSLKYTEPFSAPSKAVIKAIAKENEKDEVSDIVEYTVPEYITTNIEMIYVDEITNACEYSFYVTSDGTPSGIFMVALYNDEGQLIGTMQKTVTIDGEQEISDTVEIKGTPYTYKAFFWDNLSNMKPLCDAVSDNI